MSAALHYPVMQAEAIAALAIKSNGRYVDCTFGRGSDTRAILDALDADGALLALDRDPEAIAAGRAIDDGRLRLIHAPFSRLAEVARAAGFTPVDGVLMDLGVSSPQLDDAQRGFSFRHDGPLDMRMDTSRGSTAAQWLSSAPEDQIKEVIKTYGEERFAGPIARAIVAARSGGTLRTTGQLAKIVGQAVRSREPGQDPATRTFQAVRIYINQELEELSLALEQTIDLLAPNARLVVISFHSLEDRIVKRFMREHSQPPAIPRGMAVREADRPRPKLRLVGKAMKPSAAEIARNPRSRSATLRVAEKLAA